MSTNELSADIKILEGKRIFESIQNLTREELDFRFYPDAFEVGNPEI